ncbi:RNA polymerase sigma factor SigJ [Paenibacillus sp. 2TAB19]|uniref:RNA polymerase sigma factor SigJ n=1 Tax=Paenibacillus sp. 2TAB19 TaxID=3233003 RepID=UPI003F98ACA5
MEQMYIKYKGLLLSLAYQLTGSFSDAEDIVQDVFLKAYDGNPLGLAEAPQAYLCKMVTNRCRDLHKSARKRKEQYFGEWLPEPVPTSDDENFEMIARSELLSYAMLVMLERLSPAERAVFVLREALGFEYAGIAAIIDKNEANTRKLFSRAKAKMREAGNAAALPFTNENAAWVRQFLNMLEQDRVDEVMAMLAQDVVLISDGGGKVVSAVHPIVSRSFVSRFLLGIMRKSASDGVSSSFRVSEINGQIGISIYSEQGIEAVTLFQIEGHLLRNIYLVRNPDKLKLFQSI